MFRDSVVISPGTFHDIKSDGSSRLHASDIAYNSTFNTRSILGEGSAGKCAEQQATRGSYEPYKLNSYKVTATKVRVQVRYRLTKALET